MKRLVLMIIPALICGMVFTSCNSKGATDEGGEDGIYTGTFTVEYPVDIMREGWNNNGTVTLELKNGKYIYTSDIPPKSCSGTYSKSNDKIIFDRDRGIEYPDLHIVPPNFDINLWLNGEYEYSFDRNRLKFSTSKDYADTGKVGYYEYDLIKQ